MATCRPCRGAGLLSGSGYLAACLVEAQGALEELERLAAEEQSPRGRAVAERARAAREALRRTATAACGVRR